MNRTFTTGRALFPYSPPVENERQQSSIRTNDTPLAQILGVEPRGARGASTAVEVQLALPTASGEASLYWRLALRSHYTDGAVNHEVVSSTGALTHNPLLTVPARSARDGRSPIAGFQAEMTVNFAGFTSMVKYEEFAWPRPEDDLHRRVTAPLESRPHVVILDARPAGDGSPAGRLIEVKWEACAPAPATINRFDICLNVAHADGFTRRMRETVDAKFRRTLIGVEPHNAAITSLRVGLSAAVARFGSAFKF
ncbi:MAG: hypothetical protein ACREEM_33230 [Blastocatellia bacterium]